MNVLTENISGDAVEGPGVLAPPHNPDGPGELGKPVKIENPEPDVKKKIDQGWQDNAFNQVCMQSWLLVVPLNLTWIRRVIQNWVPPSLQSYNGEI